MRQFFALLLAFCLILGTMAGCGASVGSSTASSSDSIHVVVTIFPLYDWVRRIAGDQAETTMLLESGVDLHSYQPTVDDIIKISSCDLFVYVGGESDAWVEDALKEAQNPDLVAVNLLEVLGDQAKAEEVIEGMEEEGEEEEALDEHVWLSLRNAAFLCQVLSDQLSAKDPSSAGIFSANTDAYVAKLQALDQDYQAAAASGDIQTILFGDRFPFRYLADDYGLNYYAAFSGCSAETEASFETIVFLAGKVDELQLPAILQIESSDGSIATTIRDNTATQDQVILTMDSMQSVTDADVQAGVTYLSLMEENLAVLREALQSGVNHAED